MTHPELGIEAIASIASKEAARPAALVSMVGNYALLDPEVVVNGALVAERLMPNGRPAAQFAVEFGEITDDNQAKQATIYKLNEYNLATEKQGNNISASTQTE